MNATATAPNEREAFIPPQHRRPRTVTSEDLRGEATHGEPDPALDPIDIAANQMERLVRGMAEHVTGPLSRMRDRVDAVIRNTDKRAATLIEEIDRFRLDGRSTKEGEQVMSEHLEHIAKRMGEDVPPTVTQIERRQRQG